MKLSHDEQIRLRRFFELICLLRPDLNFGTQPSMFKFLRFAGWMFWQTRVLRRNVLKNIRVVHIPPDAKPNPDGTYG